MEMLTHPKPQLLVLLFVLPPGSSESTPHQKAGGPVRVPSLLRHAGDAQRPTAHDGQAGRPGTSPLSFLCYSANRCEFFHATPSLFIPGATAIIDISRSACQAPGALLGSHPQMTSV